MYGNRDRSRHQTALSGRGFDRRQKAKAANDALAEGEGGEEGDMFSQAGVAAE
jgi:hypothetical protein